MSVTRYILVGGRDNRAADGGQALSEAMTAGLVHSPHIVCCYFAEPDAATWPEKFERKSMQFMRQHLPQAIVELADPERFLEQVKQADILYIHGGSEQPLVERLSKFPPLAELCAGKTVVGSSAGADYIAGLFWTCDERETLKGQGILQLAFMPHYQSDYGSDDPRGPIDWEAAKLELETAAGDLPVYCMREGEFKVFE